MVAAVELFSYAHGSPELVHGWWLTSGELGLPTRLTTLCSPVVRLPPTFVAELRQQLRGLQLLATLPLWLHLVKPYGFLGAMNWEGALVAALRRPLLRLPDFLELPRENRAVLDVALVCSEPVSSHPPHMLIDIANTALAGSRRQRTTVHVFAEEGYFADLSSRYANHPQVIVHDPADARALQERAASASGMRELSNPWLLWIRDAMRGHGLDAVHFITHGFLADQSPALALADSPLANRHRGGARYVGVGELAAFLTQTGAWSAIFSSPPENKSEAGLRMLADSLAQARPGPVLFQPVTHEAGVYRQLHDLYGFLYAPSPSPVPAQQDWFAYCQPAIVSQQEPVDSPGSCASLDANAHLFEETVTLPPRMSMRGGGEASHKTRPYNLLSSEDAPELPSWVSAAQRYVEHSVQQQSTAPRSSSAVTSEVERTLQKLQAIVAQTLAAVPDTRPGRRGGKRAPELPGLGSGDTAADPNRDAGSASAADLLEGDLP